MFDKTNRLILQHLQENGRKSIVDIAKEIDISSATITKRLNKMLADGTIAIQALLNPFKMNYPCKAVIGLDMEAPHVNTIIERFTDHFFVTMVLTSFGRYDAMMIVNFPNNEELYHFIKNELHPVDGIRDYEIFLVNEVVKPYRLSTLNRPEDFLVPDEIDQKLIVALEKNGRASYEVLANIVNVSIPTVHRKINQMVQDNIIKIRAVVRASRSGLRSNAIITIQCKPENADDVCNTLMEYPQIYLVMKIVNNVDLIIGVHATNAGELYRFLREKIACLPGVVNTETFIRGETLKQYLGFSYRDTDDLDDIMHFEYGY